LALAALIVLAGISFGTHGVLAFFLIKKSAFRNKIKEEHNHETKYYVYQQAA
jgi:hypothetical protein